MLPCVVSVSNLDTHKSPTVTKTKRKERRNKLLLTTTTLYSSNMPKYKVGQSVRYKPVGGMSTHT
jgi:hypothetical protein